MHLSPMLRILASVIFLLSIVAVLLPVAANAAVYKSVAEVCNNSTRGGGQMDADGYTYLACDQSTVAGKNYTQSIQILDQQGVKQSTVWLDFRISDVAPSPNGDTLYVVRIDNRSVYRLTGKRGGPYNLDKNWKLENLPKNGVINAGNIVRGEYVATDGQGSLYVSSGLWMDYADHVDQWNTKREYKKDYYVANTIVKYTPDGKYLDNFGSTADSATDINAWNAGVAWDSWTGIAVTESGNRVFALDKNFSRVHRFDRQLNGSYKPVMTFGNTKAKNDVNPAGNVCNDQTRLAAPYDLTMSLGGELIVINTTCYFPTKNGDIPAGSVEIVRFGQDGSSRGLIHAKAVVANRAHGIVIDAANVLHVSQAGIKIPLTKVSGGAIQVDNQVFDPTWSDVGADAKGGGPLGIAAPVVAPIDPDTQAPVISSVVATQIGYSTAVSLSITATDNRGIVDVRTGEDGKAFDWRGSYQSSITEEIGFYGQKWVALQVSDAAGNYTEWFWVLAKVKEEPPAPIVVPTPVPTPAPVVTPTQAVTPTPVPAPNLSVDKAPISSSNPSSANVSKPLAPLAPPSEANLSATSPVINKVVLPPSLKTRKARIKVNAFSSSKEKLFIRFANENGKWSKLKPISTSQVMLSQGAGWKGVFVQVVDAKGNRSRIWFQTLLLGSANSSWIRGTAGADNIQGTAKDDYIDLTRFDGKKDTVRCGAGYDTVLLQPEDKAASDCEKVVYLRTPSF